MVSESAVQKIEADREELEAIIEDELNSDFVAEALLEIAEEGEA